MRQLSWMYVSTPRCLYGEASSATNSGRMAAAAGQMAAAWGVSQQQLDACQPIPRLIWCSQQCTQQWSYISSSWAYVSAYRRLLM
jgi:hypothetical protein